ncbi:hypothetical protein L861_21585 [Litchfieldella anticariensis FP35 = DSM 16096]|uniref:Uncharacterized protein n=1 Tax=Litchfieldella anticariensis (strain DSM 16096 / CECT 5854 / CIP 108499 / LMG 22089 / FP35) TaxID=1121939 RepID=S2KIM1_LITA3|nr:hypothetical protein [Halomonas anticariensis]EPC01820.1 hypothetical protein L861_21585 [Halomonas anticariensis FP35 = DSM 16096]
MPESLFYAKAMRGTSRLVGHWLMIGQADPDRLAMILADTARVAKLGEPEDTPDGITLQDWSGDAQPPLWAARAATFLLMQIPACPVPRDELEACAWAYCWLRNRRFSSFDEAMTALPDHLLEPLGDALNEAWADTQSQRLI